METKKYRKKKAKFYRKLALKSLTPFEKHFKKYLHNLNYVQQKNFFYGDYIFYRVDFYIPILKLVIEIDGKQHHTEANKKYDAMRTRRLLSLGVKKVLRFKNEEVHYHDKVEQILRAIVHELSPKKTKRQRKS